MIHIRRAGGMDAGNMAELLNEIIAIGGTTAYTSAISTDEMTAKMSCENDASAWHIAEDDTGKLMGLQWIAPMDDPDACAIATFARVGQTGLGIGSRLFEATKTAALSLGYTWIQAAIRTDNSGGIAYYQSRGFELYGHRHDVELGDGTIVSQELRRYDL